MTDLRSLDLNLLKAFDALMDEKSVTLAAKRLALARLRESFDDPLFVRVQRGIVPTNRATELAGAVKRLLNDVEALLQPPQFDPQQAEMTVSIACTDYALRAVIAPFLQRLRPQAPKIKIALYAIQEDQAQAQLEKGMLDLVLVTPAFAPPDVYSHALYHEDYVCIVRQDHPLAAQDSLSLAQFCQYEHALVSYHGGAFLGVTDDSLQQLGLRRDVVLSVQNFLILPELLQHSEMIAVVPKRLVCGLANIKYFTPPIAIPGFTKVAVWHQRTHHDPAHQWVRDQLFRAVSPELSE